MVRKIRFDEVSITTFMPSPYPSELSEEANGRVAYFIGPHGVGKSTLIKNLKEAEDGIDVVEQISHMETLTEMMNRQIWRSSLHIIEHRENIVAAMESPENIILGDRCTLDDVMYQTAFLELGWITQEQFNNLEKLQEQTFSLTETPQPMRFILTIPPYPWNVARIEERWRKNEPVKWRENDLGYLKKVRDAYEVLAAEKREPDELLLVRETDEEERTRLILEWFATWDPVRKKAKEEEADALLAQGTTYTERQESYRRNYNS